ncbi:MAG: twin-arginine translocase subunit TatC [Bacteroidales bacterium]|nr:twin-arginine translocase subunit TatC [Bacteroidales bacterium]MDD2569610.1 twin-arginine translocase subunit TatC [Bacteroidales bacterium]MDD2812212.1 twin-arginine translocase subunit TatC [Bacteroidales bacterium]MDD3384591.1 twin-arginine translocase subunit TatC [Bacteroidales bacterium]MDD3811390.1 twin-arginine translocase subunit TatC [Bacteroidales bacterium]
MDKKKLKSKDPNDLTFLEHLEVLRGHLLRSLASIGVFAIVAFLLKDIIFDHILLAPKGAEFWTNRFFCQVGSFFNTDKLCLNSEDLELINIELAGQFRIHLNIAFYGGMILAAPYIFYEIYRFILPALKERERKYSGGMVFYTSGLFMVGVLFGYFFIIPLTVNFLGGYSVSSQVENQINLKSYIGTVTSLIFSTGLVFELPIFVYFLSKVGLMTPAFMKKYRKHALVVILVLAGIITPPDVFSQMLITIPMYLLYEVSISISARIERQREERDAREEAEARM